MIPIPLSFFSFHPLAPTCSTIGFVRFTGLTGDQQTETYANRASNTITKKISYYMLACCHSANHSGYTPYPTALTLGNINGTDG